MCHCLGSAFCRNMYKQLLCLVKAIYSIHTSPQVLVISPVLFPGNIPQGVPTGVGGLGSNGVISSDMQVTGSGINPHADVELEDAEYPDLMHSAHWGEWGWERRFRLSLFWFC